MTKQFTCEHCGGTFFQAWSDEERNQEYEQNFSQEERDQEEPVIVCDDCYEILMAYYKRMEGRIR